MYGCSGTHQDYCSYPHSNVTAFSGMTFVFGSLLELAVVGFLSRNQDDKKVPPKPPSEPPPPVPNSQLANILPPPQLFKPNMEASPFMATTSMVTCKSPHSWRTGRRLHSFGDDDDDDAAAGFGPPRYDESPKRNWTRTSSIFDEGRPTPVQRGRNRSRPTSNNHRIPMSNSQHLDHLHMASTNLDEAGYTPSSKASKIRYATIERQRHRRSSVVSSAWSCFWCTHKKSGCDPEVIDRFSAIMFPTAFFIFNVCYWGYYLS